MLTALCLVLAALAVLVLPAALGLAVVLRAGCSAAMAGLAALSVAALLWPSFAVLALPFGPPWAAALLALDPLSAWFTLLLGLTGCFAALLIVPAPRAELVGFPLFLLGMALALTAADGFTLLLGFEAMSLASWAMLHDRRAARLYLIFAVFGGGCLMAALGLLSAGSGSLGFAALRAAPPEGWTAVAVLLLVLPGVAAKAGLAPLHLWLPLAHPAAPGHVSALMSAVMVKVALYVLLRLIFDICGPAQASWWGVPLLLAGAASALLGALRANMEVDSKAILACSTIENVGLIAVGLGLALMFRGADMAVPAALAMSGALLHVLTHGLFKCLLFLGVAVAQAQAGSRRVDGLGGLLHNMPVLGWTMLVGALSAAAIPPLAGFASEWLLLQALLGAWRTGDALSQFAARPARALVAGGVARGAAAMLRLWGLVFLGRPRSPRVAGAEDAGRAALILPAALCLLLGLFPAVGLGLLHPVLAQWLGPEAVVPASLFGLTAGDAGASYLVLPAAFLLVAFAVALGRTGRGHATAPAWDCGFLAPPPHLPFGDPATQPSGPGFAQPIARMLGRPLLAAREAVAAPGPGSMAPALHEARAADPTWRALAALRRARHSITLQADRLRGLSIRHALGLIFATLVLLLAVLAGLERP
ncbi:MAG: hydrogenase 4 subunit B [Rubritepida sp.]|nr:hydrogenase 4 subunit B [Rubritepida sp.]